MPRVNFKYLIAFLLLLVALLGWLSAKVDINAVTSEADVWADLTAAAEGEQDFTKISRSVKRSGLFPKPSIVNGGGPSAEQLAQEAAAAGQKIDFPAIIGAADVDGENYVLLSMPEEGVVPAYLGDIVVEAWKITSITNETVKAIYKDEGIEEEFPVKPYDHKKGEDSMEAESLEDGASGE